MTRAPHQPALPFSPAASKRAPRHSAAERHAEANRECAEVILADVERYGGEGGGLVEWARTVLQKAEG